jgi:hypothetical protein
MELTLASPLVDFSSFSEFLRLGEATPHQNKKNHWQHCSEETMGLK